MPPLDDDECGRLVRRATPTPLGDAIVAQVARAAEGNAFAAIELARCAATAGGRGLPPGTGEAVLERLCDVPAHVLALLQRLALCGDRFDVALVEALFFESRATTMTALDACLWKACSCRQAAATASVTI